MSKPSLKNIQVIDGAENCVYDIFQATEDEFSLIFPENTNVAFSSDVWAREDQTSLGKAFKNIWSRPIRKPDVIGIHGTLFYNLENKKQYYPTLRDEEAINPDGTTLRHWQT